MTKTELSEKIERQRRFFNTGKTLTAKMRIKMLKNLQAAIDEMEPQIMEALKKDLGKSSSEGYMCEIGLVRSEITYMCRHLRRLMKDRRAATPLAQYAAGSFIMREPLGTVLIMSPWNYPFLLTIEPLVDAIAAGNTAIVKPSAYSPATSAVIEKLLGEVFPEKYVLTVTGGRKENAQLLEEKYDLIFFTGSQTVGKFVMEQAAKHLTPVVLELGGKSPCIIEESAKLSLAAKRIVWGKFLNCGQTCVAPDYILCQASVKDRFLEELIRQIRVQFGEAPLGSPTYGKIINEKHFERLKGLIDPEKLVCGGDCDPQNCMIEPTVMDHVTRSDPIMQEEIFGPILPILTYEKPEEIPSLLADMPKPLAMYVFSENRTVIRKLMKSCRFGGGCINDTVIHLATSAMPFGGVGESGMGSYHGEHGFLTFSHEKSIVDKKTWMDLPMRYQPYSRFHDLLIRLFVR